MDPEHAESINSLFAPFDCFGAILYELLIAGLMDPVFQLDAYEAFAGVLVNRGNRTYTSEVGCFYHICFINTYFYTYFNPFLLITMKIT